MKTFAMVTGFTAALAAATPVVAQDALRDVIGGVAQALVNRELDQNSYAEAQRRDTAAGYQTYLNNFPQGQFRREAQNALERLGRGQPVPQPLPGGNVNTNPVVQGATAAQREETALGLTRAERRNLQTWLTGLGFATGGADGVWGNNTRRAISGWQQANRQSATGYVTARDVTLIESQYRDRTGTVTPAPGNQPQVAGDEASERALALTTSERREIQLRLTLLGYNTQGTEGNFGTNSRSALRSWQRAQGEKETGYLTADQIRALQRQTKG